MAEPQDSVLATGRRVGDYVIEGNLGGGGMAMVYRVRHAILDTVHALKVLAPQYRVIPEARHRFLDEAKIQAKHLDHPNVVKVTNIVATEDAAALVMELVDGPSLEDHIARMTAPPSLAEVRALMLPVLAAVGHAHQHGIIHRDLKPANILLARGKDGGWIPKVTDFGIAKVTEDAAGLRAPGKRSTHAEARMGTLSYMSPEQIRKAKEVTARSDVFSLGALLYELATGKVAFEGESEYDVMDRIVKGDYVAPQRRYEGLDPALGAAIAAALQPDPAARPASCEALAQLLMGDARPVAAPPIAVPAAPVAVAPVAPATGAPRSHGGAAVLSFFMLGLGQLVKGHIGKALIIWAVTIGLIVGTASVVWPVIGLPVVWLWNVLDAYRSNTSKLLG